VEQVYTYMHICTDNKGYVPDNASESWSRSQATRRIIDRRIKERDLV